MNIYFSFIHMRLYSNGRGHFVTTASIRGRVKIFDRLNLSPSPELMKQICTLYSPDPKITSTTLKTEIRSTQSGYTDCGLFAIAYAVEIVNGYDPASVIFDQSKMRNHLYNCLTSKTLTRFPKNNSTTSRPLSLTSHQITSKPARHQTAKSLPDFRAQNRFSALTPDTQHSQTTTSLPNIQPQQSLHLKK